MFVISPGHGNSNGIDSGKRISQCPLSKMKESSLSDLLRPRQPMLSALCLLLGRMNILGFVEGLRYRSKNLLSLRARVAEIREANELVKISFKMTSPPGASRARPVLIGGGSSAFTSCYRRANRISCCAV